MPRLMVRCPETNDVLFTGLVMDEASFSWCDFVFDGEPKACPYCGERHSFKSAKFFLDKGKPLSGARVGNLFSPAVMAKSGGFRIGNSSLCTLDLCCKTRDP